MLNDLLYVPEHTSCAHYVSDHRCYFRYYEFRDNEAIRLHSGGFNELLFVLSGEITGNFNAFRDRTFRKGDIVFLPKSSVVEITGHTDCRLLTCMFEVPHNVCDKLDFRTFVPLCKEMEYTMAPGVIRPQMKQFVDTMVYYLQNGINCEHFHELKQNEMFLIFRWFYRKEELATLFYPMVGRSLDFKAVVMGNYTKVKGVNDLANILHMGRSSFDTQFKEEFGTSPGQWLLKQKANHIRHYMSDPSVTISDVMEKYEFNSPTHFTRFCKQQFGCPPSELMASIRN